MGASYVLVELCLLCVVREGQEKGKGKPQVRGCCPLALSKQPVALRTQSKHQLLGVCGCSAAGAAALLWRAGPRDGCRDTGLQGGSGQGWGALPWGPAEDHLAWLWARVTQSRPGLLQDFKSPLTSHWSWCLQQLGGNCAHAACNSWVLEPLGWAIFYPLLVLQCSQPTKTPHLDMWCRNISFQGCPWKSSILKSEPQF